MAVFDRKPVAEAKIRNHQIQMSLFSGKPFPKRVKGKKMNTKSITKLEIEKYWKNKHMVEEDHLLAAIKAAARVRARNLTEEVYKLFEESLKENLLQNDESVEYSEESGVGIKDWWTKSKYAYLNQPDVGTPDKKKQAHSYVPNICLNKIPAASAGHATAYLGVF